MTPTEQKIYDQQLRDAAQRDIQDIDALAKSEGFNRYFVSQLNRLHRENVDMALTAEKPEDREKARHRAVFIRELTEMPAKHRESAEKLLRKPVVDPTAPPRPQQVG